LLSTVWSSSAHPEHQITGEHKTKRTKRRERAYLYYCCTKYNRPGHARSRVTEAELDHQVLALFAKMRIEDEAIRKWFQAVLASQTRDAQADSAAQGTELQR
jgi:site-specific DNA recombinase